MLKTFDLSITKTSHEVTTIQAQDEAEARRLCEAHHSPDDVQIHAVQEVVALETEGPENLDQPLSDHLCTGCRYDDDFTKYFLGCSHPENSGAGAEFWTNPERGDCYADRMPVIQPGDVVIETTETCASCGGVMLMSGETEWCSVCAKLIPMKGVGC